MDWSIVVPKPEPSEEPLSTVETGHRTLSTSGATEKYFELGLYDDLEVKG